MESGPIGKVHSAESRSELAADPEAAAAGEATTTPGTARSIAGGRTCYRDCSSVQPGIVDAKSSGSVKDGGDGETRAMGSMRLKRFLT